MGSSRPWGRSFALSRVGVVVTASLLVGAPAALAAPRPVAESDGEPECAASAPDEASATALALRCGTDVEILSQRTEWNTVYAQKDGHLRLEVSAGAVRSQDADGEWTPIDTSLVTTDEGITVAAPAVGMVFSDGSEGEPLVRMTSDGEELAFDVPFPLPEPDLVGDSLEYPEVIPGVDIIVTVNDDASGFSEVLRVASPEAAADPRIRDLTFPVDVSRGLELDEARGGFEATDEAGTPVFHAPAPAMWDSAADGANTLRAAPMTSVFGRLGGAITDRAAAASRAARVEAPRDGDRREVMDVEVDDASVTITPSEAMLDDPDTVWPVYIDPAVSGSLSEWVSVRDDGWTDYNYTGDQGVGRCGTTGSPMYCSKVFTRRAAWQFLGLDQIGAVEPGEVVSATLSVYGTHSYSCTPAPVEVWWTGGVGRSTTWSSLVWNALLQTQSLAHKAACGNERWVEFDVTGGARQTAAYNAGQLTVGLKAQDEGSSSGWKRYRYDARLSVVYDRVPNIPTSVGFVSPNTGCGSASAPTYLRSRDVVVSANLSDPDGDNVQPNFGLFDSAGTSPRWVQRDPAAPAGTRLMSFRVPDAFSEGVVYRYQMNAVDPDPVAIGGASVACWFVLDLTDPAVPTIEPVPGGQAVYTSTSTSGGPGQEGRFRLASTSPDVTYFAYSVDVSTFGNLLLVQQSTGVAPVTPAGAGWHTLHVRAVDRAGRTSVADYGFGVAEAGTSVWLLDEGSGTTAGDSGTAVERRPMTAQGAPTWTSGPGALGDLALTLDGVDDSLITAAPVAATGHSFSVSAMVNTAASTGTHAAVAEAGAAGLGFFLGQTSGASCPGGAASCWAFQMPTAGGGVAVATAPIPPEAGAWVQLTGVYDAATGNASLYVCPFRTVPVRGDGVTAVGAGLGRNRLTVGSGAIGGQGLPWEGSVAEVRFYDAALVGDAGEDEIMLTCSPQS